LRFKKPSIASERASEKFDDDRARYCCIEPDTYEIRNTQATESESESESERERESERVVQEEACEIEAMGSAVQTSTMHTKGLCVNQTGRRYQLLLQQPKQDKYQVTMLVG
jgi:hypothetical protein